MLIPLRLVFLSLNFRITAYELNLLAVAVEQFLYESLAQQ